MPREVCNISFLFQIPDLYDTKMENRIKVGVTFIKFQSKRSFEKPDVGILECDALNNL